MPENPLLEVFGYAYDDVSVEAERYRSKHLCPFNNRVPNCTKDKANDPLGVCSISHAGHPTITCPVRFRENHLIAEDAADFFFDPGANWTTLPEVRLNEAAGKSAGNIDVVVAQYDDHGKILDYGALEVQAVYISGNVRDPFKEYIDLAVDQKARFDWSGRPKYPRADYLSSSRKRLVPQLLSKGKILNSWGRKCAVALDSQFFKTLPELTQVEQREAEIAWLVYDLAPKNPGPGYVLTRTKRVFTKFDQSLIEVSSPQIGKERPFWDLLQAKIDAKLSGSPPVAPLLGEEEED